MSHNAKIAVLGGDMRQLAVAERLQREGLEAAIWGCSLGDDKYRLADAFDGVRATSWNSAIGGADAIILPLPVTFDGIRVSTAGDAFDVRMTEIIESVASERETRAGRKAPLVLGGKIPPILRRLAAENNIKIIDYYDREEVQVRNAVPTAEGALAIAMNELPITVMNSRAIVLGYGRIGKKLTSVLKAVGASVTVSARSERDLAFADIEGATALPLDELRRNVPACDVIFNTIPFCVLDRNLLEKIPRSALIVDLAGSPGGVDVAAAKELMRKVIWAQSLPGKCSPVSAGRIIGDAVLKIFCEEGVI